jgi:hypothetical protein
MSRSTLLLLVAVPAALLVACGSDSTSGTTSSGAGGGSTSATSAGGAGSTSTAAAGTGGDASTTTGAGTTSTAAATTATGSTGSSMAMGACTNAADSAIVMSKDVAKITGDCAQSSFGAEPATKNCIKMGTGLSDPCVVCFDDTVGCVVKNCFNECISDSGSQACTDCRAAKCDPAFVACSGLPAN